MYINSLHRIRYRLFVPGQYNICVVRSQISYSYVIYITQMNNLYEFYTTIQSQQPGESIYYNDYKIVKSDSYSNIDPYNHSVVSVYHTNGCKIESVSLSVIDFEQFRDILDEIVETEPTNLEEWLKRDRSY